MHLPHLATLVFRTPLLTAPEKLEIILAVLGNRIGWPDSGLTIPPPSSTALE